MFEITPYISFKGNCEEAINFYKENLAAEVLYMCRYAESPMAGQAPDDKILHCSLKIGKAVVMASDCVADEKQEVTVGDNITLSMSTDDINALENAFEQLSKDGKIKMPMQETFWAKRFGMLTDKFGINWMFNCDKECA